MGGLRARVGAGRLAVIQCHTHIFLLLFSFEPEWRKRDKRQTKKKVDSLTATVPSFGPLFTPCPCPLLESVSVGQVTNSGLRKLRPSKKEYKKVARREARRNAGVVSVLRVTWEYRHNGMRSTPFFLLPTSFSCFFSVRRWIKQQTANTFSISLQGIVSCTWNRGSWRCPRSAIRCTTLQSFKKQDTYSSRGSRGLFVADFGDNEKEILRRGIFGGDDKSRGCSRSGCSVPYPKPSFHLLSTFAFFLSP